MHNTGNMLDSSLKVVAAVPMQSMSGPVDFGNQKPSGSSSCKSVLSVAIRTCSQFFHQACLVDVLAGPRGRLAFLLPVHWSENWPIRQQNEMKVDFASHHTITGLELT